MLITKQLIATGIGLLLLVYMACLPSYAHVPLDTKLKTDFPEDPYANDGVSFRVLCYHDARDNLRETFQSWPERGALDTSTLIEQFEWLRENGYHMVSLDAILAARNGGPKLPSKAILLTFDDGYLSMYTRIFPLLKLFNYPAVIGLVGEWLDDTNNGKVFYGDRWMPRKHFVTWPQVREMVASGLVEVASHSHSLHKGSTSNPQGSLPSSAITRIYDAQAKHYETDAEYVARIRADLAKNSALIAQEIGKKPRVMIWPYGAYNMLGAQASEAEGMPITMTLEPGSNTPDHPLARMRRDMLFFHDKVSDLKSDLRQQERYDGEDQPLNRIVAVDLDALYDPDPVRQDKKLGDLIERIKRLRVNTVYLRAVADLDHDGYADAAYFPNRHLPMRADLFNRAAWQLRTRASVEPETLYVYAWLPILAFESAAEKTASNQMIKEIYEDAAKNAPRIGGLLFGNDEKPGAFSGNDLTQFTHELMTIFKVHQPYAFTARLIPAASVTDIKAGENAAPTFASLLKHYDFVTLSLTKAAEDTSDTDHWLELLTDKVAQIPNALNTTVFLLPTTEGESRIPSEQLADQLRLLQQNGGRNFGYYPDQAAHDHPLLTVIRAAISLQTNPGKQP
ncbi:poly-beta-1,6-N-acetyl-D-glucosamine N-deacetylase PgaB [Methyloglobulus sp.]|uniref:poly-beta-1,6-N-acetyl-D-glucosamine N-deacetylase PgaB n=1 Tax=Methyloglobulus sp. TaxID=2518622 RepID=UPI0032B701EE